MCFPCVNEFDGRLRRRMGVAQASSHRRTAETAALAGGARRIREGEAKDPPLAGERLLKSFVESY